MGCFPGPRQASPEPEPEFPATWQNRPVDKPAIALRLATPGDAQAIALMSRDFIETGLGWRYDAPRIVRALRNRNMVTLVATERGRIVGFGIMDFGEERAHLVLLAVLPTHRRKGVGRRLIEWLTETALTAGIESIHLELRAKNESARRFYAALGFSETYVVPGYYQGSRGNSEGALRMLRVLRRTDAVPYTWRPPRTEDT